MIELKPCPFCGNEYISVIPSVNKTAWWCKCVECKVTTPCYQNKDAAITAWNMRANDAEYIDRDRVIDRLCEFFNFSGENGTGVSTRGMFKLMLSTLPAADVQPVVHGKWIVSRTDYGWNGAEFPTHCKCDQCGREIPYFDKDNYCPNCGARMDGEI